MEKFLDCIDEFEERLKREILSIVEDQSIPLTEKNRLMAPLSDQKKIITQTKKELQSVKDRVYEAKCEMYKFQ